MKTQSYKNHIRWYIPHHFIYYPVLSFLLGISIYFSFTKSDQLVWIFFSIILLFLFWIAFMLRQHYALTLQNRIVRLELRYNYYTLTGKRFEVFEHQLTDGQIFALRFAADDELESLVTKTLAENLSGKQIKKAIVNWKGDYNRV